MGVSNTATPNEDDLLPRTREEWLEKAHQQSARFWSKVERNGPDECWPWRAGKDRGGYGKFQVTGRGPRPGKGPVQQHVRAHRLAWELTNGLADPQLVTIHSCDNPACCNPEHLTLGTQAENRADCIRKNRDPFGERNGNARITDETAREVYRRKVKGERQVDIARRLGISVNIVYLVGRQSWKRIVSATPIPEEITHAE